MTMTPALGALAQVSDALTRAAADAQSGAEAAVTTTIDLTLLILGPIIGAFVGVVVSVLLSALLRKALAKAATASSARPTNGGTPSVYGTVPQPRATMPSSRPRRSVFEHRPEKTTRGPRWHDLDARSAERTRPPTKTAYSRSVVAPPVPASRQIIRAVIVAIIVIGLIALTAITIKHMLGSLIHPSAGAHIIEEVRTWQSPWPTV